MSNPTLVRASGIIIYNLESKLNQVTFLLLKSSNKPFHWTPPKGRLDPGETTMEAAFRETMEEAGLPRTSYTLDDDFVEKLYYEAHGADKECTYHLAMLSDRSAKITLSDEHTEFKWVKLEEIPVYCDKESLRVMFVKAHKHLVDKLNLSV